MASLTGLMSEPLTGFGDLVERFDHVSLGVRDISATLPLVGLLGGTFLDGADHSRGRFRWVQFDLPGNARLELIQPLDGNDFLESFLQRRGEGVHHLTFKVHDLDGAVERAHELGMETTGYHRGVGWHEVFLHPRSTGGVVIQLAEWVDHDPVAASLEEVLAGHVQDPE